MFAHIVPKLSYRICHRNINSPIHFLWTIFPHLHHPIHPTLQNLLQNSPLLRRSHHQHYILKHGFFTRWRANQSQNTVCLTSKRHTTPHHHHLTHLQLPTLPRRPSPEIYVMVSTFELRVDSWSTAAPIAICVTPNPYSSAWCHVQARSNMSHSVTAQLYARFRA